MARSVSPEQLGAAIAEELTLYHENLTKRVNGLSKKAAKDLAKKTKVTAPVGATGDFSKGITSKLKKTTRGCETYVWGGAGKAGRFTHLLVHGHETKDGGRAGGNSFLVDAMDEVLPEYEENVKEAIKNG